MKKIIALIAVFVPAIASAQPVTDFNSLSFKLSNIGNTIIGLLIALAVIWIIFNVIRYIISADDPEKRKGFGVAILWSIVGLFVILSIWGLVAILSNTFGTSGTIAPTEQFLVNPIPGNIP